MSKLNDIWQTNKKEYLIVGIIISLSCLLLYSTHKIQLQYSLPFGWLSSGVLMFVFGLITWRND